jgi:apolipoprotein N-acyltransferase
MASTTSIIWLAAGAGLLSAVSASAVPPAAWVALTLMLHGSRGLDGATGIAIVFAVSYVSIAIGSRGILPLPAPGYFALAAAITVTFALPFAIDRLVAHRLGPLGATLVFPLALVASEFLRSRFTPAATWLSIAYSQYGFLPLMQIASLVGIWGITFVVAWSASTFEWAWRYDFAWAVVRTPVLACAAVVGVIVFGGSARLLFASTEQPSLRVATLNRPVDLFVPGEMTRITEGRVSPDERPRVAEKISRLHDWFLDGSRREARAGARLVAWPEANLIVFADDEAAFLERARRVAADEHIYLAIGLATIHVGTPLPFENKAVVIDPNGAVLVNYLKTHPVSGWEAGIMRRGDGRLPVVATDAGRLATAICFDADFPEFIRQAGQRFADLLILPANEWRTIKYLHQQMAAFRAIENGVPIVRPAASGISSAIDPWGRVLGVSDFFSPGDRTLTAQVPIGGFRTLYARTGDLFAWLCVAGLVAALTRIG